MPVNKGNRQSSYNITCDKHLTEDYNDRQVGAFLYQLVAVELGGNKSPVLDLLTQILNNPKDRSFDADRSPHRPERGNQRPRNRQLHGGIGFQEAWQAISSPVCSRICASGSTISRRSEIELRRRSRCLAPPSGFRRIFRLSTYGLTVKQSFPVTLTLPRCCFIFRSASEIPPIRPVTTPTTLPASPSRRYTPTVCGSGSNHALGRDRHNANASNSRASRILDPRTACSGADNFLNPISRMSAR